MIISKIMMTKTLTKKGKIFYFMFNIINVMFFKRKKGKNII